MGMKNEGRSDGTAISLNLIGATAAESLYRKEKNITILSSSLLFNYL
jgi:hypothetical protein